MVVMLLAMMVTGNLIHTGRHHVAALCLSHGHGGASVVWICVGRVGGSRRTHGSGCRAAGPSEYSGDPTPTQSAGHADRATGGCLEHK